MFYTKSKFWDIVCIMLDVENPNTFNTTPPHLLNEDKFKKWIRYDVYKTFLSCLQTFGEFLEKIEWPGVWKLFSVELNFYSIIPIFYEYHKFENRRRSSDRFEKSLI